ncbi:MAG: SLC13 family permease [bacterium]
MARPEEAMRAPRRGALLLLPLLLILFLFFLTPPAGLGVPAYRAMLVAAAAIVLWTSEALPAGVTSILLVLLLDLTGAAPSLSAALSGFSSPVAYFLIGVLTLGIAVEKVGLAERLARFFLRRAGGRRLSLFWQMILSFPLLTFLLPSATTRSGILAHVYDRALSMSGVGKGAPLARAIMMALNSINRLASTALLTGGITPIVAAALIGGIGWGRWFTLLAPPYYLTLAIGSGAIHLLYLRGEAGDLPAPADERPPFAADEIRTGAIVLGASLLWLTDAFHHLHPALPALLGWALLLAPGIGVLTWKEFETRFPWANFFILASSLSLGRALVETGAAKWLAHWLIGLAPALASRPYFLLAAILLSTVPIRILIPNITGFLAIMIPIGMEMGLAGGLNPLVCGLGVMIMGDTVLFYPAQSASSLVVYERGHLRAGEIFRFGVFMTAVAFAVTMTFNLIWWRAMGMNWAGG